MEIEEFNLPTWRLRSSHVQSSGLEEPPCLETLGSGWEKRLLPKAMDHPVHPVRRQTEMLPLLWIWASGKFPAKQRDDKCAKWAFEREKKIFLKIVRKSLHTWCTFHLSHSFQSSLAVLLCEKIATVFKKKMIVIETLFFALENSLIFLQMIWKQLQRISKKYSKRREFKLLKLQCIVNETF